MDSGERSVEKVHWMLTCLPLSAHSWDTQQDQYRQSGNRISNYAISSTEQLYKCPYYYNYNCKKCPCILPHSVAEAVPVWLTSLSCSSPMSCLSLCLGSAPTTTQTCSSNTYINIACGEVACSCMYNNNNCNFIVTFSNNYNYALRMMWYCGVCLSYIFFM